MDVDVFLRPNEQILKEYLHLDDQELIKLIGVFPQLLGHNPITLESHCRSALLLLTGLPRYLPSSASTSMVMRDPNIPDMVSESELGQGLFDTLTRGMVVPLPAKEEEEEREKEKRRRGRGHRQCEEEARIQGQEGKGASQEQETRRRHRRHKKREKRPSSGSRGWTW